MYLARCPAMSRGAPPPPRFARKLVNFVYEAAFASPFAHKLVNFTRERIVAGASRFHKRRARDACRAEHLLQAAWSAHVVPVEAHDAYIHERQARFPLPLL